MMSEEFIPCKCLTFRWLKMIFKFGQHSLNLGRIFRYIREDSPRKGLIDATLVAQKRDQHGYLDIFIFFTFFRGQKIPIELFFSRRTI